MPRTTDDTTDAPQAPTPPAFTRESAWRVPPVSGRSAGLKLQLDMPAVTVTVKVGNQSTTVNATALALAAGELFREGSVVDVWLRAQADRRQAEETIR